MTQQEKMTKGVFELISKFSSSDLQTRLSALCEHKMALFIEDLSEELKNTMKSFKDIYDKLDLGIILKEKDFEFRSRNNRKIIISGKHFSFNPEYYFDMLDKFDLDYDNNSIIEFMIICLDCIHIDTIIKDNYIVYKAIDINEKKIVEFTFSSTNNNKESYFYKNL